MHATHDDVPCPGGTAAQTEGDKNLPGQVTLKIGSANVGTLKPFKALSTRDQVGCWNGTPLDSAVELARR